MKKLIAALTAITILLAGCQNNNHYSNQADASVTSAPAQSSAPAADPVDLAGKPLAFTEAEPDHLFDQMSSLIRNYQQQLVQAINTNIFSEVEPYLAPGSSLYEAQSKLVSDLYSRQIKESMVSSHIYGYTIEGEEYHIEVTEKVKVDYPDKGTRILDYHWLYAAKQVDGELKLSALDEWKNYDQDMEQRSGAVKGDGYYEEMLFDNYPAILEKAVRTLDLTDIRRISGSDTVFEQQKALISWFRRTGEDITITAKTVKEDPVRQYGLKLDFVDGYKGTGMQMVYFQLREIHDHSGFGGHAVIDYWSDHEVDDAAVDSHAIVRYRYIRLHPDMPEYLLKVYGRAEGKSMEDQTYHANKIELYEANPPGRLLQSIPLEPTDTREARSLGVIAEDMNFDGYLDLRIQQAVPAGPNIPYLYWLWNPESNVWQANNAMEELTAPEFDPFTQTIHSFNRGNAAEYSDNYYRVINGTPVLVLGINHEYDPDKDRNQVTVSELVNGQIRVTGQYEEAAE
jgi:hypothetical protein